MQDNNITSILDESTAPLALVPAEVLRLLREQQQMINDLVTEVADLKQQIEDIQSNTAQERAYDRKRIAALERETPQPKQKDRGEVLIALLAATPQGKMLQSEARKKMGMDKSPFSLLLRTVADRIDMKPYHRDRRQKILILK